MWTLDNGTNPSTQIAFHRLAHRNVFRRHGLVVGYFIDSSVVTHGFFFVPPNQFSSFDYPGSTFTSLNGINDKEVICARYVDASGIAYGFLARLRSIPPAVQRARK
jgi:hypothetical protein